jgi:hypothetical protein
LDRKFAWLRRKPAAVGSGRRPGQGAGTAGRSCDPSACAGRYSQGESGLARRRRAYPDHKRDQSRVEKYEGRTIEQIARDERKDPLDALMDIVVADRSHTMRVTFPMNGEDMRAALKHPLVSMGTDSPEGALASAWRRDSGLAQPEAEGHA